jgi:hypothetical protein
LDPDQPLFFPHFHFFPFPFVFVCLFVCVRAYNCVCLGKSPLAHVAYDAELVVLETADGPVVGAEAVAAFLLGEQGISPVGISLVHWFNTSVRGAAKLPSLAPLSSRLKQTKAFLTGVGHPLCLSFNLFSFAFTLRRRVPSS